MRLMTCLRVECDHTPLPPGRKRLSVLMRRALSLAGRNPRVGPHSGNRRLHRNICVLFACLFFGASLALARAEERKDREFQECRDCPVMVAIPAGRFLMGSPGKEAGQFENEGPQHLVAIRAFALGKYDVTSEEFLSFLRATGYQPKPCNPILRMQWHSP